MVDKPLFSTIAFIFLPLIFFYIWASNHGQEIKAIKAWAQKFDFGNFRTGFYGGKQDSIDRSVISVVIGLGITSRKMKNQTSLTKTIAATPFFTSLLPSFCQTASIGYHYHFYIAYDKTDTFYSKADVGEHWQRKFHDVTDRSCPHLGHVGLHLIRLNHSGRPVWAQNEAMMAAYRDGVEYFYRVNDDTRFITTNWTTVFINALQHMRPPLVGVVGPNHHGGNPRIMTYDFVHRTHIDIFGYYYPHEFSWWFADYWITNVYLPNRSEKISNIHLRHTMSLGQRYINRKRQRYPFISIKMGRAKINAYLNKTGYHGP